MENSTKTENTIDLRRLWMLLRAHIWAIIAWAVGLGAVGFVLAAFVVEPKYFERNTTALLCYLQTRHRFLYLIYLYVIILPHVLLATRDHNELNWTSYMLPHQVFFLLFEQALLFLDCSFLF